MRGGSKSETITENIFREFYGNGAFIEKSAIPSHYGFKSKKGTGYKGYPDFFRDNANEDFVIIVEAKADDYKAACEEVEFYAKVNKIDKDILAIAISGQTIGTYKSSLFIKFNGGKYKEIDTNWKLLPLESLRKIYRKEKIGDCISVLTNTQNVGTNANRCISLLCIYVLYRFFSALLWNVHYQIQGVE